MPEQEVKIENMTIQVPEQFKDEAQNLGQEVVRNISTNLPRQLKSQRLDTLNLCVTISKETTRSQLTTIITEAILKGLV